VIRYEAPSDDSAFAVEHVACNLCGSRSQRLAYRKPDERGTAQEWFSVVECTSCGLGFVNPRPPLREMGRYYPESFYRDFESNSQIHESRYAREAAFVLKHAAPAAKKVLLDVGCANGGFPRHMKSRGWDVQGLEISKQTIPISDFPVFTVPFPEIDVDKPSYDAVTAWAVLEHVHDPMAHFAKAARVLKPGGVFVFLVTNFQSLASRNLFCEDVPRHLYFFTDSCVQSYLQKTGFQLVDSDYSSDIFVLESNRWLAYYVSRLLGRPFAWQDASSSRQQFFEERRLEPTLLNRVRYGGTRPLIVLGRALLPLHSRVEMMTKRYGIATYVARRLG
jgi:SAM-dependent methyltransferase